MLINSLCLIVSACLVSSCLVSNFSLFSSSKTANIESKKLADESFEEYEDSEIQKDAKGTGKQLTDTEDDETKVPEGILRSGIEGIKYIVSVSLLCFSIFLITMAMFTEQTKATENGLHPAAAFCIYAFLIVWLSMMEGGQGCLVGLQPVTKSLYADSHPRALKSTELAHKGNNMERFVVGRQFLVVLVIFVMNMMVSTVEDATILGLPSSLIGIFLGTGFAVILTTMIVGQLTAQVNAATCMLDFINNYFMLFTVYTSLAIEASGLLHSVYLINIIFSKIAGKEVQSNEPPRSTLQTVFFWVRVFFSLAILAGAFVITLTALFTEKTMMWEGVPEPVSVAILFFLMCFVGIMEGLQIALFAVMKLPENELSQHQIAHRTTKLVFSGHNLGAFLIGRQICVTVCMFVVARITAINVDLDDEASENILGVSDGVQTFLNTGLLGAVITTIVASLIWRVIASSFPVAFLSNPLVYVVVQLCLLLESSGICSASWILASIQKKVVGFRNDEEYLGKPELDSESKKEECSP